MKNTLKKLGAIALVLMLMLSLSVNAFADATMDPTGIVDAKDATLDKVLNIPVKLKVFNPDESSVYAPNITYSFSVVAGSANKTITDTDSIQAATKTAALPTYTNTLSWSSATTTVGADSSGDNATAANVQNLTLNFSSVAFGAAGVYRYTITETATYTGTGVTAGETGKTNDTTHVLYLDVYVKDGTAAGDTIYGYVLHTADDDTTSSSTKVEGFEDEYYTSNLTVSKTLVNDAAMNSHQFPFSVTFDASSVTAGFHLMTETSGTATVSTLGDKTYTDTAAKIANGGSIKYVGIPGGVSATVKETVDVAGTTYKVTSTGADTNINDDAVVGTAAGTATSNAVVNAQTTTSSAAKTVAVTNTLLIISPTGVVMRVAPYALMLIGGFVLLVISRRRKAEEA